MVRSFIVQSDPMVLVPVPEITTLLAIKGTAIFRFWLTPLKEGGEVVIDRRNAIKRAVQLAQKGDAVVVLGKGHETGQEVNGVKSPFSDVEELKRALSERS